VDTTFQQRESTLLSRELTDGGENSKVNTGNHGEHLVCSHQRAPKNNLTPFTRWSATVSPKHTQPQTP